MNMLNNILGTGGVGSPIMVVDIHNTVKKTVYLSELGIALGQTGMICGVMPLCDGSVKKWLSVEYVLK